MGQLPPHLPPPPRRQSYSSLHTRTQSTVVGSHQSPPLSQPTHHLPSRLNLHGRGSRSGPLQYLHDCRTVIATVVGLWCGVGLFGGAHGVCFTQFCGGCGWWVGGCGWRFGLGVGAVADGSGCWLVGWAVVKPVLSRLKNTLVGLVISLFTCIILLINAQSTHKDTYITAGEPDGRAVPGVYNDQSPRSFEPEAFCGEPGLP
ncbi:hypothetical protein RJ639_004584 [Escallonia herrerae]|uniref:Uncharacterized protein n=1 Tax=Escallonia herrerae TaxID=1293975 RepID=A0AA88W7L2_9ASTE|nr:hypothetical protein RJ639_004584 [Escallonia herrerae]